MIKKIGKYLFGIILGILCLLAFLNVYKMIINLLKPNEIITFFGYTDYIVIDDKLEDYSKGDLAIIKVKDVYYSSDYVLYIYQDGTFFGKIESDNGKSYVIENGNIIYDYNIIGKAVFKISNFENIYNLLTSPLVIVIVLVSTFIYFYLIIKGRVKENK